MTTLVLFVWPALGLVLIGLAVLNPERELAITRYAGWILAGLLPMVLIIRQTLARRGAALWAGLIVSVLLQAAVLAAPLDLVDAGIDFAERDLVLVLAVGTLLLTALNIQLFVYAVALIAWYANRPAPVSGSAGAALSQAAAQNQRERAGTDGGQR